MISYENAFFSGTRELLDFHRQLGRGKQHPNRVPGEKTIPAP